MEIKKVIVAPDSFKGSLTAREAAESMRSGVLDVIPDCEVVILPLADGGEGTVDALAASFGGTEFRCEVKDPLGRRIMATYLVSADGMTALMETAQSSGLTLLLPEERNPMLTSTYGLGMMIGDALSKGCRRFLVGLGGSATNDGGMGMLRALGYRFFDALGHELEGCGADLGKVAFIDRSDVLTLLSAAHFTVACDVDNPLCGERGASAVFAPQKGADREMVSQLENGMRNFADVVSKTIGVDIADMPGAGAAGGLGGAFRAFLGAEMRSGIEVALEAVRFDDIINGADLIITGEGSVDRQSLMGKVLSGVLAEGHRHGVPVATICGKVKDKELLECGGVYAALSVDCGTLSLEEAMARDTTYENLRHTTANFMKSQLLE